MQQLEAEGELEREVEFLPSSRGDAASAARRARAWSRPELAVLLAYAKRAICRRAARVRPARLAVPAQRPASVLPAAGRGAVRPPDRRAPAAARARRDDRGQRRRELPGHHVRLADGDRDRRRARPTSCARSGSRATSPARSRAGPTSRRSTATIDPAMQNELMTGVDWLVETTSRWYLVHGRRAAARRGGRSSRATSFAELSDVDRPDRPRGLARGARARRRGGWSPKACPRRWRAATRSSANWCTAPTSSRSPTRPAASVLEVARGFFLLGERLEIDWLEQQLEAAAGRRPAGSAGRSSRWRTTCSRCAAGCASACWRRRRRADRRGIEQYFSERARRYERVKRFMRGLKTEGVSDLSS